ncbi:MAG: sulfurtransferase TusA family protein [Proteobacteria bacterium]|nr:sulfurtransferase TusA family protein [Pseudomonadota bacterium]MDA1057914.1 sulfurtransferase TusA family protein [Pseudomonadota bacterium]
MTQCLDLKGLKCPLPVLRAKKTLKSLDPGDTLEVLATDPGAAKDFQAFCETTGTALLAMSEANGVYTFLLQK